MSTTPPVLPSFDPSVVHHYPIIPRVSSFIKAHEILIAIVLGSIIFWSVSGKVVNYFDNRAHQENDVKQAVLQAKLDAAASATAIAEQHAAEYKALTESVLAENTKLNASIAARDKATSDQQGKDKTLPPSELAQRWEVLANLPLGSVAPQQGSLFSVTDAGARLTVIALEEVPKLQGDLKDVTAEKSNSDKLLASSQQQVDNLNKTVTAKNEALAAADGACKAEIKVIKDDAAKSKRKWAIGGAIVGFIARTALKITTGI